jgi:alpha-N-acetylglucosamine transferase
MVIYCVLKSGGEYDAAWVRRLRDGVARNLTIPHEFICLSDVDVPCERIPLRHNWPGWWSKIELFKHVERGLYLDLDTVVTGSLDHLAELPNDFAMLRNFHNQDMVGSGVMWFGKSQKHVYDRFCAKPYLHIAFHERMAYGPYLGDQAFIWDSFGRKVEHLPMDTIKSYKKHCKDGLPTNTSLVCFHGLPKLPDVKADWIEKHWR